MRQVCLDVELWVNGALQTELAERGLTYHSLTDYDIQLTEAWWSQAQSHCMA